MAEVLDRLEEFDAPILVATSQVFFGEELVPRVGLIAVSERPGWLWEGFMAEEAARRLRDRLREKGVESWLGGWDAMFATGWEYAWTVDEPRFRLIQRAVGTLLEIVDGAILLRGDRIGPIEAVESYVSADWVERGVRLVVKGRAPFIVASVDDQMPQIDPTYDWIALDCEAGWARALGRTLAAELGVPHRVSWDD
ncbi:MAG: hypothetical protein KC609_03025 [Myxococcales bacterium]|nr:hypothetical protein [Myxococcales bacterium]